MVRGVGGEDLLGRIAAEELVAELLAQLLKGKAEAFAAELDIRAGAGPSRSTDLQRIGQVPRQAEVGVLLPEVVGLTVLIEVNAALRGIPGELFERNGGNRRLQVRQALAKPTVLHAVEAHRQRPASRQRRVDLDEPGEAGRQQRETGSSQMRV